MNETFDRIRSAGIALRCPACAGALDDLEEEARCETCARSYEARDGVLRFGGAGYYWGEIPQEEMQEILAQAQATHWREAVSEALLPANEKLFHYVTDERRTSWSFLADLPENARVMDLGSGWGSISTMLAPRMGVVVAVEGIDERVQFIETRARQEKLDNLIPVQADLGALPFADESFDLIVMNGLLEWVGLIEAGSSPGDLQARALREMHRMLKPGGTLYIGIENRLAYAYFLGQVDHSGLRFTSLMPRRLADAYVLLRQRLGAGSYLTEQGRESYRAWTYSSWGYRRILADAGFDDVDIWCPIPTYNEPFSLVHIDDPRGFAHLVTRVLAPLTGRKKLARIFAEVPRFLELFAHSFSIFARKSGAP